GYRPPWHHDEIVLSRHIRCSCLIDGFSSTKAFPRKRAESSWTLYYDVHRHACPCSGFWATVVCSFVAKKPLDQRLRLRSGKRTEVNYAEPRSSNSTIAAKTS